MHWVTSDVTLSAREQGEHWPVFYYPRSRPTAHPRDQHSSRVLQSVNQGLFTTKGLRDFTPAKPSTELAKLLEFENNLLAWFTSNQLTSNPS